MEALLARVSQFKDIEDVDTLWETLEDKNEAALESLSKKVGSLVKNTSKAKAHDESFEGEDDEEQDFDQDEMDEEDFDEEDEDAGSGFEEEQDNDQDEENEEDGDEEDDDDIDYNAIIDDSDFDNLDPKEQLRLLNRKVKDDKTLYDEDELEEVERFKDSDDEDDEEEMEEFTPENKKSLNLSDDEEEADELADLPKSNFERQQDKLKRTIAALESENIGDKNWTLRGEITAKQRPSNSLLEEDLEFEHMTKAAPVITEEVTESLEDIIKKRIRDRAWDNVEPKFLEKTEAAMKRPTLDLNDAKSKQSLAQVYENEFEKKRKEEQEAATRKGDSSKDEEAHLDEATKAAHESIKKLFGKICTALDTLSENKFSPRTYAMADVEIKTIKKVEVAMVKGLRSLDHTLADVVPSYVPREDYQTAEEVYQKPKRPVKGVTELTREERHSAHLRKKRTQKTARKADENRERVMARFDPKVKAALEKKGVMKSLAGNKNVTVLEGAGKKQGGKKWKHSLGKTLLQDRSGEKSKASDKLMMKNKKGSR